jgi:hypothetical protein
MRNNTNYMETGVLSALELTAISPKRCSRISTQEPQLRRIGQAPKRRTATCCPAGQKDMTRVEFIVNILRLQGIEVGRATAEVKLKRRHIPGRFADRQAQSAVWPAGQDPAREAGLPDANLRTYDDTGWTMGLMSQAEVKEISDKACSTSGDPVDTHARAGEVKGIRAVTAVLDNGSNSLPLCAIT